MSDDAYTPVEVPAMPERDSNFSTEPLPGSDGFYELFGPNAFPTDFPSDPIFDLPDDDGSDVGVSFDPLGTTPQDYQLALDGLIADINSAEFGGNAGASDAEAAAIY